MKLLLIDDNQALIYSLKLHLSKTHDVDIATTGEEAIHKAAATFYDVILLDLNLQDMHGSDICQKLRQLDWKSPILVLTGDARLDSRISLLDLGADDYVTKPFNIRELEARIRAVGRRLPANRHEGTLVVRDLIVDSKRRVVKRAGITIRLRRKEFDILEYLVRHQGRAVTRTMIVDHAWGAGKEAWHNTVDVHIKYLRDKVDRPFETPLIKTAYGIGYMVEDAKP